MRASETGSRQASGERRQRSARFSAYADVQVEITLLTFRNVLQSTLLSSISVIGVDAFLAFYYSDSWMWNMFLIMLYISATRIAVIIAFFHRRHQQMNQLQAWRWEATFGVLTFFHCLTLASSTLYVYGHRDTTAQNLCLMGIFALSAKLGSREVTRPWIALPSGLVMLATLTYAVLRSPNRLSHVGAVMICLYAYAFVGSVCDKFAIVVEQLRSKRKLRELAEMDPLTGLANRRQFQKSLEDVCRDSRAFSILYIDLDGFKQVNDMHGHPVGDLLLQQVAGRLRNSIRSGDVLARLGGDEFAILQASLPAEDLPQALATRINESIATLFLIEGQQIRIGASIGIRTSTGTGHAGSHNPGVMLSMADTALYRVKQAGGGSFALAED